MSLFFSALCVTITVNTESLNSTGNKHRVN